MQVMKYVVQRWGLWVIGCMTIALSITTFIHPVSHAPVANAATSLLPDTTPNNSFASYLPLLVAPTGPEPLPPPIEYAAAPPIDYSSVRASLQQQGLDLAFGKMGFHTGAGGNVTGLYDWINHLDTAGVPVFLKSVDDPSPVYAAQQRVQESGVPHTLIFRRSGAQYDVPNYDLSPVAAAQQHWALHKAAWPAQLDPGLVWIETLNEVDKNRSEWLAEFALETAQLALTDGFKWAAFGWSSGEPEPYHWQGTKMRQFLHLVGQHPDRLAIALHEYSYSNQIGSGYPFLVGRFQALFQVCDAYNIPRPTVLITEWGWHATEVPPPEIAIGHIEWAAWLYAAYPQVKGAAIWYLGGGFGGIADQAQRLIAPVQDYSLTHYFGYKPGQGAIDPTLFQP